MGCKIVMAYEQNIRMVSSPHADHHPSEFRPSRRQIEQSIKNLIDDRRERASYFPETHFADPAWDILLVLTLWEARQRRVSVSQICDAVDLPATTILRWIHSLTDQQLLVRRDDFNDRRRTWIGLSPAAYARMVAYCSATESRLPLAA